MQHRIPSSYAYFGTLAAATLAAVLMSGAARAESPIEDIRPIVGERTRAEVKAETVMHRQEITSYGGEFALQSAIPPFMPTLKREQVRADYLAARDSVRQMNAEDSGSAWMAQMRVRPAGTMTAEAAR